MTAGVRGGGFVMGAVGGLALALLLVGAVSYLPQANPASQALYSLAKDAGQGATAAVATTQTAASTSAAGGGNLAIVQTSTTSPGPQAAPGDNAPRSGSSSSTTTTAPPAVNVGNASAALTTTIPAPVAATTYYTITVSSASFHYGAEAASGGLQQRPNSLLTVLPGESVGNLTATLSPLLIGLLVAVLIYSAYSRRQDSSS
jgi:hypothetical protein